MFERNLTYLVTVNDCKKLVRVAEKKDIVEEILRSFNLVTQSYVLQMYHSEWMDYVEVESLYDIPDGATLKLIVLDTLSATQSTNYQENYDISVGSNDNSTSEATWPDRFRIPEKHFTVSLVNALARKQKLSWAHKHEFLSVICDTIMSYTLYPSKAQIVEVANEIVNSYDHLKDYLGYSGWVQCLINKLKNVRRNLKVKAVQMKKKKHKKSSI